MSDEKQQAVIGRTMEEYAASKKKLAALQGEAINIGNAVFQVGKTINTLGVDPIFNAGPTLAFIDQITVNFPTGESLRSLAQDIKSESERKQALYLQLKTMGFEPRD